MKTVGLLVSRSLFVFFTSSRCIIIILSQTGTVWQKHMVQSGRMNQQFLFAFVFDLFPFVFLKAGALSYTPCNFSRTLALTISIVQTTAAISQMMTPTLCQRRSCCCCRRSRPIPPPPTKPTMVAMRTLISHL